MRNASKTQKEGEEPPEEESEALEEDAPEEETPEEAVPEKGMSLFKMAVGGEHRPHDSMFAPPPKKKARRPGIRAL